MDVYINDFYGASKPSCSHNAFQTMNNLFDELGLLASDSKEVPPCHRMVCLGIEIDTLAMTLTVPRFRVDELNVELHHWLDQSTHTKHALQSLLGKLSYVSACVRLGRVYMCRLLNALRAMTSRHSELQITDDMRADIEWWIYLLQHYNEVSVIPSNVTVANPDLFACDACPSGCGAVILGDPWAASREDRISWAKVYNKSGRAPGHLLLPNEFQKRLKSRLLIGQKNIFLANQRRGTAGRLSCLLTRGCFLHRTP